MDINELVRLAKLAECLKKADCQEGAPITSAARVHPLEGLHGNGDGSGKG